MNSFETVKLKMHVERIVFFSHGMMRSKLAVPAERRSEEEIQLAFRLNVKSVSFFVAIKHV